jgi:competence protein ComFB
VAFVDDYDFELLKNEAENLVLTELGQRLASYPGEICTCNDCVVDMAAIALNSVKPLYRYSILGTLYAAEVMNDRKDYAESIHNAVDSAIEKVRQNPSHD